MGFRMYLVVKIKKHRNSLIALRCRQKAGEMSTQTSQQGEPPERSSSSMEEVVPQSTMDQYSLGEPPRSKKRAAACAHACEGLMTLGLTALFLVLLWKRGYNSFLVSARSILPLGSRRPSEC